MVINVTIIIMFEKQQDTCKGDSMKMLLYLNNLSFCKSILGKYHLKEESEEKLLFH